MAKWTPFFQYRDDREVGRLIVCADIHEDGELLGSVILRSRTFDRAEKIARMWAASKDMLAALELAEELYMSGILNAGDLYKRTIAARRAAIAKAKGESTP